MAKDVEKPSVIPAVELTAPLEAGEVVRDDGKVVNASGHVQEVERNFNLWSIISMGIVTTGAWCVAGGTITVALYSGGPPGVLYELIAVTFFYGFVAASIAELASAIPSSAGVYHWASVTAGKYSRIVSFFAGWSVFSGNDWTSVLMDGLGGTFSLSFSAQLHQPQYKGRSSLRCGACIIQGIPSNAGMSSLSISYRPASVQPSSYMRIGHCPY